MVKYPKGINESDIEVKFDEVHDPNGEKLRYYLAIKLDNIKNVKVKETSAKKSKLVAIMMNPSKANKSQSDRTVNKIIRIAKKYGYEEVSIYNSIPFYETKSSKLGSVTEKLAKKFGKKNFQLILKENLEMIMSIINSKDIDILLATGNPKIDLIKEQMDEIYLKLKGKEVLYYKENKSGYFSHPLFQKQKLKKKTL